LTTKILLLENIHPIARKQLESKGYEVDLIDRSLKGADLTAALSDVDVVGIRSKTQLTSDVLDRATHLSAIGAFCIGTNQIDLDAATRHGVPVFNAPFSNTRSVAEMIVSEIVMLSRRLGDRNTGMHKGEWRKSAKDSYEVRGHTLGVIGYGHIGRQVGVLAEALGLRVYFYDIAPRLPMGNNRPCESMDELLSKSDFVTLHVPETPQTRNMFGKRELQAMQEGSYLLNASRGTVVDIPALAEAIESGHLAGAAIDVFPSEPGANTSDDFQSELKGLTNVILTPHIGGSTVEAQEAIGREVSTAIDKLLATGATTGSVNFPEVEMPPPPAPRRRIANVHRNVPGVLSEVNRIVSQYEANVVAQVLATHNEIGYLLMDLDRDVADAVCDQMQALETHVRVRVI
jgi:D-3-phosphoglycerate dehydrogenase